MANKTKIILTGGGTLGSVMPLIAIYQELLKQGNSGDNFLWVGTLNGPEKDFIEKYGIKFRAINSGKLRRYFSFKNFLDIFYLLIGFIESLVIIADFKPGLIISAGSFVSVPVVWAARFLGKKIIIHQQDFRPGLANKIMAAAADKITVTFKKSLTNFNEVKTILVGNPVREEIIKIKDQRPKIADYQYFGFNENKPVLLILGGGTGALTLNKLINEALPELLNVCQIIHLTGKGKGIFNQDINQKGYYVKELLNEELIKAYQIANLVISRAGMATLTELSYLGKPTIVIPLPDTHQEDNVEYFAKQNAVIYLKQSELTIDYLLKSIKGLLENKSEREKLGMNFKKIMNKRANENFLKVVDDLIKKEDYGISPQK